MRLRFSGGAFLAFLGVATASLAQDLAPENRAIAEPTDLIRSTTSCADAVANARSADELFADENWSIETGSTEVEGETVDTYRARHTNVDMAIQYWPGIACWVFGSVPHSEFDGAINVSRSIGLVVNGARDKIAEQYGSRGFRSGTMGNPILMTDEFEIEFTMLRSTAFAGSDYIISVSAIANSDDN